MLKKIEGRLVTVFESADSDFVKIFKDSLCDFETIDPLSLVGKKVKCVSKDEEDQEVVGWIGVIRIVDDSLVGVEFESKPPSIGVSLWGLLSEPRGSWFYIEDLEIMED